MKRIPGANTVEGSMKLLEQDVQHLGNPAGNVER